ncbi:MAG TPA: amino acid adenylation domain-containing protein [Pyrinomonadaceae bacterium]
MQRARDTTLGAYAHQDIPFELLIEVLDIERSLNHAPLVQVVFTFQNAPTEPLDLPDLQMAPLNTGDGASEYDLNFFMSGGPEGLLGSMVYNSDLFDRTTIRRLVNHYQRLLEAVVADPLLPLDVVSLLSPDEVHQLLVEWNDSRAVFPSDSSIPLIFEQLAARRPDALALAGAGQYLSYGCLNRRANQLAWYLRSLGVSSETRVAVALPRAPEMIVTLLAILKAGGAYLALDPSYPLERLAFMLEDAEVPVIVTLDSFVDRLPSHLGHVVCLDTDDANLDSYSRADLPASALADNIAYITYTSGSTGEPKGVEVTHRAVLRLLLGVSYVELNAEQRLLHLSPLAFDASTFEIWGALLHGGCCVLGGEGVTAGSELEKVIAEQQVRTLWLTSSLFNTVMDYHWTALQGVEQLLIGGEALSLKHVRAGREKLMGTQIINGYGPTESTTFTCTWRVDATVEDEVRTVSIGRTIENTQVYVLDHRQQTVGVGVVGELWIGGDGLARGYLNRSPATAERFLPDGVSGNSGGRLYRTGDLVRYLPDGRLEYLGRLDHQVKVRGFRIELGEVESVLARFPGIDEVVAVVREDQPGTKRLIAYFVFADDSSSPPSDAELRQFMHSRIPDYLVPSVFVRLDHLPLNENGKVNRKALPVPEFDRAHLEEHYLAPRNDSEQALARVWSEVLSVPQVGIRDNYFELGGDSIHSIQVVAKARECGLTFSIQELFTYPTIEQLSDHLSLQQGLDAAQSEVALEPFAMISAADRERMDESIEDAYPLTRLQAGMIFHTELNPETAVYHDIFSFYLEAPLDETAMSAALRSLIKEHEILRTSVDLTEFSEPLQLVHREADLPVECIDITELTPEQQEQYLSDAVESEKRSRFDWQRAPLMRLRLYRRSAGKFQLMLSFHHAILDGWSLGVFLTELFQRHAVESGTSEPVPREVTRVKYRDYVALEQRALKSEASRTYWDRQLQALVPTKLPRRSNRKPHVPQAKLRRRFIPSEVTGGLYEFARRLGVPLKTVLLAAHLRVLSAAVGENDVITGVITHGRLEQQGGERLLGLFLNTIPLRLRMEGGKWAELVRQVYEAELENLKHRYYPMAELQKRVAPELLFETSFNFIHFHVYEELEKNEELKVLGGTDVTETNYPFSTDFALDTSGEHLVQSVSYDESEFGQEQIVRLEQYYERVLVALSKGSEERYERFAVLTEGERQQLLQEWNDTGCEYGGVVGVHELVAQQAARTPEAIAVVSGEQQLSYGELQRRAQQLGLGLQRLGVGPEVRVGICLERSVELVVALLGTLAAGGCYVPLDPAYPETRLEYMLADAGVAVVLTQHSLVGWVSELASRSGSDVVVRCVAEEMPAWETGPAALVDSRQLAYLIYTSGSTGRPKAVAIEHRNAVAFINWAQQHWTKAQLAAVLASTSVSFDLSVFEMFVPLSCGGTVVMAENALQLRELAEAERVTLVNTVPSAMAELVRQGWVPAQTINLAGEALQQGLAEAVLGLGSVRELNNLYGPSEDTTYTTWSRVEAGEEPTIGRPIANTQLYVVGEGLRLAPVGVVGEIVIGGAGLARGYLQQAGETAARFVPDPFGAAAGGRLYRTGDLGRYRWDGELEYLGRMDQQVKVRGYRIELGEIESVLREQVGVREAVVVARGEVLVGYVVSEVERSSGEWRECLQQRLPAYMVPAVVMTLAQLPLTANGKVDRRSLPAPELGGEEGGRAPRTGTEEAVAGIWSQVLGVEQPGVDVNFFDLGGHSLVAIRVLSRVRQVFGVELGVRELFEHPTIAGLAVAIEAAAGVGSELPRLEARERSGRLPLSYAQQRLWFLDQLLGEPAAYNMPSVVQLGEPQGVLVLEQSLSEVVRRHEALRTRFESEQGEAVQVVEEARGQRLGLVDLRGLSAQEQQEQWRRLAAAESGRRFDLRRGPLLRGRVLQLEGAGLLLLTMHHIIGDGWSTQVLQGEWERLYQWYERGEPSRLRELEVQYGDYAVWQRQWPGTGLWERQMGYWRRQLAGAPAVTELPLDGVRSALSGYRGGVVRVELEAELTAGLERLRQQRGLTMFMVMVGSWKQLLGRYSGQRDLVVGTPVAGRNRMELEGLIGCFINTLVLRSEVSWEAGLGALLEQEREVVLQAQAHGEVPFEQVVEELAPERSLSHTPLFQVLVTWQQAMGEVGGGGAAGVGLTTASKFDLSLGVVQGRSGMVASISYNRQLFSSSRMQRLARHWEVLLRELVRDAEQRLGEVELLSGAERQQLLWEWNDTESEYRSAGVGVHELVARQAERTPEAIAVVSGEQQLSYGELERRANQLGHYLQWLGVGPEVKVGVCLERSAELIVALLGTLKAGGCYVPLDPAYPESRLAYMLADAQVAVVLTQAHLSERLPASEAVVLELESAWSRIELESTAAVEQEISGPELAYLIYTSGSTGRPKAVGIEHRNAVAFINWAQQHWTAAQLEGVLASTSVSFDLSVFEMFVPLSRGGTVIVVENALQLRELAEAERVTLVNTVPSAMAELVRQGWVPATVQTVNLAGEALQAGLVAAVLGLGTVREVNNLYGPSEDTTYTTWSEVEAGEEPTIGRPIANTQLYVVGEGLRLAPLGVVGEIVIGGAGLARGYLQQAGETAARFVPDPFGAAAGGRLYRTGDLGRYRWDGELEYLGRMDQQVKVRGYRIELGEIESVLREQAGVREAVVVARSDGSGPQTLVGYVVSEAGQERSSGEWRECLQQRSPAYMVPAVVVTLAQLPLTANGKVDRRSLPAPELEGVEGGRAPRTGTEEAVAGIWSQVLGVEQPGVDANFFDLGGHSLVAIRVLSRVRQVFGVELGVRELFEHPTIAGLAVAIEAAVAAGEGGELPRLEARERAGRLPLSYAQQRLWFLDQLLGEPAAYNMPSVVQLGEPQGVLVLEQSLSEVMRRHEALRTRFESEQGEAVQVVEEARGQRLGLVDLRGLSAREQQEQWRRLAAAESGRRFDLRRGPLLRGRVLQLEGAGLLLLTMHHIIGDGWSTQVLQGEWERLYQWYERGEPSRLRELEVQYGDYAVWQRQWPGTGLWERQMGYWRRQLEGAPAVTELPLDGVRSALSGYRGGVVRVELEAELTAGLERLRQQRGLTMFMVMVGSWKQLLGRYSGQRDLVVGTPVAGRNRVELEGLIGCFINTLVLRSEVSWEAGLGALLEQEREVVLQAQAHGEVPFEQVVEELAPERSLSHTPLFQVLVTWQQAAMGEAGGGAATVGLTTASKFDLSLGVVQGGSGMVASISYNLELFSSSRIQRLARHWEVLLRELVRDAEQRLGEVELLSGAERQQLLQEWNDTESEYETSVGVHELVAQQAERTPEAIAVVSGEQQLSYGELNRRANQLGHYLRRLGVGPEVVVGICIERSVELIVGLLGILKAGGAYLPLDPDYPQERLEYMLANAGVKVLLTQRELRERLLVGAGMECLELGGDWFQSAAGAAEWSSNPESSVSADTLAYLIYTSGSTGQPKGVAVPHRGIVRLVQQSNYVKLDETEVLLQMAPVSFDASTFEIWGALLNGARLVVMKAEQPSLAEIADTVARHGVTTMWLTAGLFQVMAAEQLSSLREVKQLLAGGDVLGMRSVQAVLDGEETGARVLINGYGPTENTTFSCCHVMKAGAAVGGDSVPIGRPITNTHVYVLDDEQHVAPLGARGELYLGGDGLARGYAGHAELTAERFVPDGVSGRSGERLYRTGDMVRYNEEGLLEFIGRADQQVKVRGYRIELGEVEEALAGYEGISDSVVVVTTEDEKRLVGYVVAAPGAELKVSELREYLSAKLPGFMIPSAFVELAELPLTANGKVDRKKLAAAELEWEGTRDYEAPRTEAERLMAVIWTEVLGVERLGIHDNFFDLGGHSLLAIRMISRMRQVFEVELGVRELFERPTIAGLAAAIEEALPGTVEPTTRQLRKQVLPPSLVPIQPNGKKSPLFLIHSAGGFVFTYIRLAHHLGHDQPVYGLQAHGVDGDLERHTSVEEMAAEYVKAIRAVQPEGPYQLGGWSFGGVVAFETAQQLQAQGQEVNILLLIDSSTRRKQLKKSTPASRANLLFLFSRQLGIPAERAYPIIEQKSDSPTEALDQILEEAKTLNVLPPNAEMSFVRRLYDLLALHVEMIEEYKPQPYKGRVVLLRASEALPAGPDVGPLTGLAQQWLASKPINSILGRRTKGWETVVKTGVEVHDVPGTHFTMMQEPNVTVLAEHLTALLKTDGQQSDDGACSDKRSTTLEPMNNNVRSEAISLTNVRKAFDTLVAVDDVNLTVYKGEIFGLLGPNGAGKTTLIRMIMDIIRPDSGSVEIFGHPPRDEDKERIGYLPEERGLYARQKVFSILEYFAQLKGLSKQQARRSVGEWLEKLNMTEVKDKKVAELSKGNQQRVQLIATLVADPEIVILDEPLSGLDPIGARTITTLIRDLSAAGKTVLLSSHQMGHVEMLCERVLMINKGRAVLYGDLNTIKRQYSDQALLLQSTADYTKCSLITRHVPVNGSVKVYLKDGAQPRDLVAWILESGAEIISLEPVSTSLEEIFINVVEDKK